MATPTSDKLPLLSQIAITAVFSELCCPVTTERTSEANDSEFRLPVARLESKAKLNSEMPSKS